MSDYTVGSLLSQQRVIPTVNTYTGHRDPSQQQTQVTLGPAQAEGQTHNHHLLANN